MSSPQKADPRRPLCILNGHSARAEEARVCIVQIASEYSAQVEILVTGPGDDITALAARAVGERRGPIVAGGGDGTVNAVAGKLAGTDASLGVLPLGTLNHFAKDAGVPLSLDSAVRNLFTGRVTRVDVGEVNGRVFVNNSGIGFYPHFVRQRQARERQGYPKPVAFMLAVRWAFRRYMRLRIRMGLSAAEAIEHATPFLFVGNNRYCTSGPQIGSRSTLESGRLWVCAAPRLGRHGMARSLLSALAGRAGEELTSFELEEMWVDPGTPRVNVSTDGEVCIMDAPLHYRIRPRALAVIVPERGRAVPAATARAGR